MLRLLRVFSPPFPLPFKSSYECGNNQAKPCMPGKTWSGPGASTCLACPTAPPLTARFSEVNKLALPADEFKVASAQPWAFAVQATHNAQSQVRRGG